MRKLVTLLLVATMPVLAEEPEDPHLNPNLEEVIVTGYTWEDCFEDYRYGHLQVIHGTQKNFADD